MRHDPAHVATDKEIEKIEKQIAKEYRQAHKEVSEKLKDYFSRFEKKDAKWQEWVKDGSKTEKEYIEWRKGQILVGERWKELRDTLAQDYANVSKIALSICKEHAPDVYALNHNYATFEVEKGSLLDTSYTLYSRESVERMYRDNPKLYHNYGKAVAKEIKAGKQKAWDRKRIQSVLMQGLLQGESIPKLTKRLEIVTKGDHKAAVRNARTMMTGVQNAGRIDAYDRANKMGIPVKKQWLATVDGRTRHWHRQLDGAIVENDEPFENEFGKIMFPGDPEADGANVYNCRCTLLAAIKGFELDVTDPSVRPMPKLKDMTYDEWKADKKSVRKPITGKQEPTIISQKNQQKPLSESLVDAYEYHRTSNNLNLVSADELGDNISGIVSATFTNLDNDVAEAFSDTIGHLINEYDTPLTKVRSLTKQEAFGEKSFAFVHHNYETDSAEMVINPLKCKHRDNLVKRIAELSDDGYAVKIAKGKEAEYVATHEFAHTLVDMVTPLNNKRNWANADYKRIKRIRNEVNSVYEDYLKELRPIEEKMKSLELDVILNGNEKSAEEYRKLDKKLSAIKLSDYSLENSDEFMAEAFTHSKLSKKKNAYADRIMEIINREFKK